MEMDFFVHSNLVLPTSRTQRCTAILMTGTSHGLTSSDSSGSEFIRNVVYGNRKPDLIHSYFNKPNYEPKAADFVESAKAPFAVAEFLSFLLFPKETNYTGSVLVRNPAAFDADRLSRANT